MTKKITRRWLLGGLSAAASLAILPLQALARATAAFTANSTDKVMQELYGNLPVEESAAIKFKVPDIAENGAVVPVTVATEIEGVEQISIVVDQNSDDGLFTNR